MIPLPQIWSNTYLQFLDSVKNKQCPLYHTHYDQIVNATLPQYVCWYEDLHTIAEKGHLEWYVVLT